MAAANIWYSGVALHWQMAQRMASIVPNWSFVKYDINLGCNQGILPNAVALNLKKEGISRGTEGKGWWKWDEEGHNGCLLILGNFFTPAGRGRKSTKILVNSSASLAHCIYNVWQRSEKSSFFEKLWSAFLRQMPLDFLTTYNDFSSKLHLYFLMTSRFAFSPNLLLNLSYRSLISLKII